MMLAHSATGRPGVATADERSYFYEVCKRGNGFSAADRCYAWLQVTGA